MNPPVLHYSFFGLFSYPYIDYILPVDCAHIVAGPSSNVLQLEHDLMDPKPLTDAQLRLIDTCISSNNNLQSVLFELNMCY